MSYRLESEYYSAVETGRWNRRLEIGNGEFVAMHSETIIVHFPSSKSSLSGSLDDWGQVQPPTVNSQLGVNFINILRAPFLYESESRSFL